VYDRCQNICLRKPNDQSEQLREIEKMCGRNCIRKFDKTYKLFGTMENRILQNYVEDEDFDVEKFTELAE